MTSAAFLRCILPKCGATLDIGASNSACPKCGSLLDVAYEWTKVQVPKSLSFFEMRWGRRLDRADFSGVWRFRELLPFANLDELVTVGEGQTLLQHVDAKAMGIDMPSGDLHLQYEGLNPSGSFKDNGMAAATTMARKLGKTRLACASTGNTSASMAMFAATTRTAGGDPMQPIVFIGAGKIALGKLAQALDHDALTLQIDGDFDACMRQIQSAADRLGLYVMNSVNPFRLEGQKSIMYRVLEGLGWDVPDWIVVPGGNLGNTSAFGKAFAELRELGLVHRIPRLAVINAAGADTLYQLYHNRKIRWNGGDWPEAQARAFFDELTRSGRKACTVASAIEIARPVNLPKALRALEFMNGVVSEVTDEEILDAKAAVGRCGFGCEPASAASVAGLKRLLAEGVIDRDARIVCILTGHALKDPDATVRYHASGGSTLSNRAIAVKDDLDAICAVIEKRR